MSLAGRGNCNRPYGSRDAQGENVFWNTPVEVVPEWVFREAEKLEVRRDMREEHAAEKGKPARLFVKSIPQGLKPTLILLSLRHD